MFTDIAGYTSIMASEKIKVLSLLQEKRQVLKPLSDKHDGSCLQNDCAGVCGGNTENKRLTISPTSASQC